MEADPLAGPAEESGVPKWWGKVAMGTAGIVGIVALLVGGIFLWIVFKFDNAEDRADEESAAIAASIAAEIDQRGVSVFAAASNSGGILIRQDDGPSQTKAIVRVRAIDTGFGGGPIQNEHCYEFSVPKASGQKVSYKRVHLDLCVEKVVPKGSPPKSGGPSR